MEVNKLHFFDKEGYELNFDFDESRNLWEGNIYLPPVSVGLYSNTTIFVLEEVELPTNINTNLKHKKDEETVTSFVFPRTTKLKKEKLTFRWDTSNSFVDEIFMFSFDENYTPNRHSSLSYGYNNGPDCKTLLVNRFDKYEVNLDYIDINSNYTKRVLPIHVAFSSAPQYDGTTYKRTLIMSYNDKDIARITFFAESIEEDERLKTWTYNLGYNITPEDTIIFKKSDIEEPQPNYILLNEKRKEMLIEGHNIYPYVGSYRAIMAAIKFFGYDNLNLIEFWKNIDPSDDNFGKFVMSPKYVLSDRDNTFLKDTVDFSTGKYRKGNKLAFTYTINTPTEEVDLYELPYVREDFTYSMNEVFLKLFALRKKLNKEFLPSTTKIIDIIGEAFYFGLQLVKNGFSYSSVSKGRDKINMSISKYPKYNIHISDDNYFNNYIIKQKKTNDTVRENSILKNIGDTVLNDINPDKSFADDYIDVNMFNLTESEKCELFKTYHESITYNFTNTENVIDNDTYDMLENIPDEFVSKNDTDYITKLTDNISAKVILTNTTYNELTFNDIPYPFKYIGKRFNQLISIDEFQYDWEEGVEKEDNNVYLKWTITYSPDQLDENYHDNDRKKYFDEVKERYDTYGNKRLKPYTHWKPRGSGEYIYMSKPTPEMLNFKAIKYGKILDVSEVLFELPYVGYYDVELTMYKETVENHMIDSRYGKKVLCSNGKCERCENIRNKNVIITNTSTFKKYIRVEPHKLDIRGFYYDSREFPNELKSQVKLEDMDEQKQMEKYILETLNNLTYLAKNELNRLKYKSNQPGGYDLQMILDRHMNKINESKHYYNINRGPYAKQNFKFGEYIIQDGEIIINNVDKDILNLIPNIKTARYIHDGVDIKPYTWIYLTFDYGKIVHRCNPTWVLTNNTTGKKIVYEGNYFTCLIRDEGDYTINLSLYDEMGNIYEVSRNIFMVRNDSNYDTYTPFKHDYLSLKSLENYMRDIRDSYIQDNTHTEDETVGEDMFDFKYLRQYNYVEFINFLTREKEGHNEMKYYPTGTHISNTLKGRYTIKPGEGLGWNFEEVWDASSFDYLNIDFSNTGNKSETYIPENDDLELYIIQNDTTYYYTKITSQTTKIDLHECGLDMSNLCYVILFNMNKETDENFGGNIEISFKTPPYFSYKV